MSGSNNEEGIIIDEEQRKQRALVTQAAAEAAAEARVRTDAEAARAEAAEAAAEADEAARAAAAIADTTSTTTKPPLSGNAKAEAEKAKTGTGPKARAVSNKEPEFKIEDVANTHPTSIGGQMFAAFLKGAWSFSPITAALVHNPLCVVGGLVSGIGSYGMGIGLGVAGLTLEKSATVAGAFGAKDLSKKLQENSENAYDLGLEARRRGALDIASTPRNVVYLGPRIVLEGVFGYFSSEICGWAEKYFPFAGSAEKFHMQTLNTTWEGKDIHGKPSGIYHQGNPHHHGLLMARKNKIPGLSEALDKASKNGIPGSSKVVPSSVTGSEDPKKSKTHREDATLETESPKDFVELGPVTSANDAVQAELKDRFESKEAMRAADKTALDEESKSSMSVNRVSPGVMQATDLSQAQVSNDVSGARHSAMHLSRVSPEILSRAVSVRERWMARGFKPLESIPEKYESNPRFGSGISSILYNNHRDSQPSESLIQSVAKKEAITAASMSLGVTGGGAPQPASSMTLNRVKS